MPIDKQTLQQMWPRVQWDEWKAQGFAPPNETYEEYLAMRGEQAEQAAEARRQGLTGVEFPDEVDAEELALLDRMWAQIGQEQRERESQQRVFETAAA